jgi:hypothetical protein
MSSRLSCTAIVREIHKMIQGRDIGECKTITMILYIYVCVCVYVCVRAINPMGYTPCCKTCLSIGEGGECVWENKNMRRPLLYSASVKVKVK